jgi:hypothetical protein
MVSVAGVAMVPPAPGIVVAPLGAAMLAASGAASIVAAGTAAGKAGKEAGLAAFTVHFHADPDSGPHQSGEPSTAPF